MSTAGHSDPVPVGSGSGKVQDFHYKFTVQKGFFQQSEDETDDKEFDFKTSNFGLINRTYSTDSDEDKEKGTQWQRFEKYIRSLETSKQAGESYKVLFLGRHGQGWHNVAETKYGTKAWDCYWSALDGADGITWADAHLTPLGEAQAKAVNELWSAQLVKGIPAPETYYVSPLTLRFVLTDLGTIQTASLSFSSLPLPASAPYKPLIKELLREALGVHTCDRRSTRSEIQAAHRHLTFEPGFAEEDELWLADYREPRSARNYRLAVLLDEVFEGDEGVVVSMTSHSGAIGSLLVGLGHREFALETGGVIPVFVKGERVQGKRPVPPKEPSDAPPLCPEPPVDM
ncbi:hypothetical protein COCSADRAFT_22288 [Bipolaris sorokiniana ND90Pr]|uniref:Phosphoglycerate mutase family protein n=1 Tax=Cochliobolus sativus (strain ND90Pr / ATCC 201652) TaxID=665912 RepID=M2TN81_COCSN|nr:uncharacterized protein COCSADRAFT_22288 [Bipolaris sorokiniana ND90Pr]EMD70147.1 hypothetical protein COCSADRAFT_22288 [Bipolaris sorokiniana ND90Pr]